jgi:hypothetical protein
MTKRLLGKPSAARLLPSTPPARAPADVGHLLPNAYGILDRLIAFTGRAV